MKGIEIKTPLRTLTLPNSWTDLTPSQFVNTVALVSLHAAGMATQHDVKFMYVCHAFGINPHHIVDADAMGNLAVLANQVTFIFNKKGKPELIFPAQLIPEVKIGNKKYNGYTVRTHFDTLTCSLTAAQFIDAHSVIKAGSSKLALLASILYFDKNYNSEVAHALAEQFSQLDQLTLQAIAVNFQALVSFLFTRTPFSILAESDKTSSSEISTGLSETMYNLCTDGYGTVADVKQIPLIEFLTILRKKLIDAVTAMHAGKMNIVEIMDKTGLHSRTIKKILNA